MQVVQAADGSIQLQLISTGPELGESATGDGLQMRGGGIDQFASQIVHIDAALLAQLQQGSISLVTNQVTVIVFCTCLVTNQASESI